MCTGAYSLVKQTEARTVSDHIQHFVKEEEEEKEGIMRKNRGLDFLNRRSSSKWYRALMST